MQGWKQLLWHRLPNEGACWAKPECSFTSDTLWQQEGKGRFKYIYIYVVIPGFPLIGDLENTSEFTGNSQARSCKRKTFSVPICEEQVSEHWKNKPSICLLICLLHRQLFSIYHVKDMILTMREITASQVTKRV